MFILREICIHTVISNHDLSPHTGWHTYFLACSSLPTTNRKTYGSHHLPFLYLIGYFQCTSMMISELLTLLIIEKRLYHLSAYGNFFMPWVLQFLGLSTFMKVTMVSSYALNWRYLIYLGQSEIILSRFTLHSGIC